MKLIDLLSVISEYTHVTIVDSNTLETLSYYDEKNSIDEKYNDCEVVRIFIDEQTLSLKIILLIKEA